MKKPTQGKPRISPATARLAVLLPVNSVLLSVLYFTVANAGFDYVLYVYTALAAILGIAYVVYNKGFALKNATPEMLPDTQSLEERVARIADAEHRLSASRWVLTLLFPLVFAVSLDIILLVLLPMLGINLL